LANYIGDSGNNHWIVLAIAFEIALGIALKIADGIVTCFCATLLAKAKLFA